MDDLLADFLTETSESLAELDTALVKLERTPNDEETLSLIFRMVHTIKGTCGFLGLSRLKRVAHAAENVLGRVRDKVLKVSFDIMAAMLLRSSGLVIGPEKLYLLETRLAGIMREIGGADLDKLADRLQVPGPATAEIERKVVEAMTTNESFFFRDEKPFTHFRTVALPRLIASRPPGARLRVWSAASSSGQEAYSLAMIVAEMQAALGGRTVEIVGTDLSREQVLRAQQGVYSQFEVQRGLPMQYLVKYFKKDGANWRLNDSIRAMASFREWNLLADPRPLGNFDVVFCRNVLIYFDRPTKTRVLDAIARQMRQDGLLYLGGAETVLGITDWFDIVPDNRGVYELARKGAKPALAIAGAAR